MTYSLSIYLLEEKGIFKDEPHLSCFTSRVNAGGTLDDSVLLRHLFGTESEFKGGLVKLFEKMSLNWASPQHRHLIIISAHGIPHTGTYLALSDGNTINLHCYEDYFKVLPKECVVFLSACLGGYPAPIQGIQGKADNKPTFIAPIVAINGPHNQKLQNEIIDALLKQVDYENYLIQSLDTLNNKWQNAYFHKTAIRIVTKSGKWIPDQNTAGYAAEVEGQSYKYRIVALQSYFLTPNEAPLYAVLFNNDNNISSYWQTIAASLAPVYKFEAPFSCIGNCIETSVIKIREPSLQNAIGIINIEGKSIRLPQIPSPLNNYSPPFSYCYDVPDVNNTVREVNAHAINTSCRACNWAMLKWANYNGQTSVTAVCRKKECAEHKKIIVA